MANRRFIDFPIASSVGENDIILIWQSGANKQTTKGTLLSGIATELENLTDVQITSLANGQILEYDSVIGKWKNVAKSDTDLSDLGDVSIVSPVTGQVLVYNASTGNWENSSAGLVPYVGAVSTVDLGLQGIKAGWVRFDTSVISVPEVQGTMYWDGDEETVAIILNGSTTKIGEDLFFLVKNQTGSTIPKGTNVGFAGVVGASGRILVTPYLANGSNPSLLFVGVTYESIPDGGDGKALSMGKIRGVDTTAFVIGDILFASPTVAGGFTTTKPIAPNNIISVAAVLSVGANGIILVRPQLASNINNDEGVKITTPATGELLQYQAGGLWENKNLSQILGGTSSQFVKGDASLDSTVYQNVADKGQPNGYASLDANSKVPLVQINDALIGNVNFQGLWNASTNTPTLVNPPASDTKGYYYIVDTGGTFASITFEVGDWIISNGTAWGKVDNTDAVSSVFGRTGNVVASNGDYNTSQVTENTNLYYTDLRARGSLSFASGSGGYNSTTGVITIPTNNNQITNGAGYITGNQTITLSGVVTGSGTTAITTAIANGAITNTMLENSSFFVGTTSILLGRASSAQTLTGVSIDGNANTTSNIGGSNWIQGTNIDLNQTANGQEWSFDIYRNGFTGGYWHVWDSINGEMLRVEADNGKVFAPYNFVGTLEGSASTWTTARTITIGNAGKSVNGGANVDWSLAEIGAYASTNPSAFISLTALSAVAPIEYNNTTGAISITQASVSTNGFLSSTDWNTFNNKQNALSNPVTGTGTTNYLPKFTGTSTIGNSALFDGGGFGGFNSAGLGSRTFVINAASGRPLALELIENANVHSIFFRPNNSGFNLITSNYLSGGVYLPLSLSARENNSDLVLATSGNLLVGTTSDNGARLSVTGNAYLNADLRFGDNFAGPNTGIIKWQGSGANISNSLGLFTWADAKDIQIGGKDVYFGAEGGAIRMLIASSGNVLIGTTTDVAGVKLNVNGAILATSFFESSDATLKTLIANNYQAKGIGSVVAKLYIKNGKEELGYYAQDLQEVLPSAVSKGSDGLLNLSYREVHTAKIAYLEEKIKQLENVLGKPS